MVTKVATLPFHQSIIGAISSACNEEELAVLGQLICNTSIPEDHDVIAGVFEDHAAQLGLLPSTDPLVVRVATSLRKRAQEEKPRRRPTPGKAL